MTRRKARTAMAIFMDGKWQIGLPGLPGPEAQPVRVRVPLPERAPRRAKARDPGAKD